MSEDTSGWVLNPKMAELMQPRIPHIITPAESAYIILVRQIVEFEQSLSRDEEIGGRLVTAPSEGPFHIEDLSHSGHMIIFYGKNQDGRQLRLVQHHTQTSVLLTALPKMQHEPRRIGFILQHRRGSRE